MDKPPRGPGAMPSRNFFWPIQPMVEPSFVIRVLWWCGCHVLKVRENIVAKSCILYSSLIIVKSLQLRGHLQIAEPRKYCLVRVNFLFFIFFLLACVFSIFVSHKLGIRSNSLQSLLTSTRIRCSSFLASATLSLSLLSTTKISP